MNRLKPLTVARVLVPCLAVGLVLAAACNGDQAREATPAPEREAQQPATVPVAKAAEVLLQEIVATINAYEGPGPMAFSGMDLTTRSCSDLAAEVWEPCLLLETSTISAAEARVMVGASHTTVLWEFTLESDGGEWRITGVKDLEG